VGWCCSCWKGPLYGRVLRDRGEEGAVGGVCEGGGRRVMGFWEGGMGWPIRRIRWDGRWLFE